MKLVIVESPAKAKTIGRYLGRDYQVAASIGHIRDLPKSNRNAIDIEKGFVPHYEITPGKEAVVEEMKRLGRKAEGVILATDPDREGEAIAWHIKEACDFKRPRRIVFHEITEGAVAEALAHPRDIDKNLKTAQEARRVLDRLFGYDLSGLIWRKLRYGLSAGRVQSPALRILVEREREIRAFKPEKFWLIEAECQTKNGQKIIFLAEVKPKTEAEAKRIVDAGRRAKWQVTDIKQEEARREPRAPFITSTLQQAASSRLGMSPAVTMRQAQKLYEAGEITYMRTDSPGLSEPARREILQLVAKQYGQEYARGRIFRSQSKIAQEAHEAIRPTRVAAETAGRAPGEKKLYQLIWRRAVSSQMSAAEMLKTKVTAAADDDSLPSFFANGMIVTFDGWLRADPQARGEETELPPLKTGEPLTLLRLEAKPRQTEPPRRHSEAGLVRELEKRGIGRPSTYAPIIQTIIQRGYVTKENRSLRPTETGEAVSEFLEKHFDRYISDSFTKEMEDDLDEIAAGRRGYVPTLKEFYGPFRRAIAAKQSLPKINQLGEAPAEIKCPLCGGPMLVKLGRAGKFFSCVRFPDCRGARTSEGKALNQTQETGKPCPQCQTGKLITREGRFGAFVACSNYPKCKYTNNDEADNAVRDTGIKCPVCGQGTMTEKRGRYGTFYGCSAYPQCRHIVKNRPTGRLCPQCGALMMEGTKTIPERCSNKTCPHHQPGRRATKEKSP